MSDENFAACHELAMQIVPELRHVPLYLVPAIGESAERAASRGMAAFLVRGGNLAIRQFLIEREEYNGAGITIMFVNTSMPLEKMLAITVHELGHGLPLDIPEDVPPTDDAIRFDEQLLAFRFSAPAGSAQLSPWTQHGADFIRNCLHLCYRSLSLGYDSFGWADVGFAGEQYDLSSAWRYARALGDEPQHMWEMGASFDAIAAISPPEEFTNLFNNDTRKK